MVKDSRRINVAILGAGGIAHAMATTLNGMAVSEEYRDLVRPYAVAARDGARAADFAAQYGIPVSYGSYEELYADPEVDLIYIATPHSHHAEQAIAAMRAGKGVLVEKSFAVNAAQARESIDVSHETGMLCTEAIWTRYMPSRRMVNELIASGAIGHVKAAAANLCYPVSDRTRLTDPNLAGGALLDIGVYPLNFLDMAVGADHGRSIASLTTMMKPWEATGVDEHNSTTILYDDGLMGVATSSMSTASDRGGYVWGDTGYLVCENINNIQWIDVFDADHRRVRRLEVPKQITGYEYEVAAAARAILDGRTECEEMPHADTIRIVELMDQIRATWGLTYPFE